MGCSVRELLLVLDKQIMYFVCVLPSIFCIFYIASFRLVSVIVLKLITRNLSTAETKIKDGMNWPAA